MGQQIIRWEVQLAFFTCSTVLLTTKSLAKCDNPELLRCRFASGFEFRPAGRLSYRGLHYGSFWVPRSTERCKPFPRSLRARHFRHLMVSENREENRNRGLDGGAYYELET